jgi:hypothetical protein
VQNIKFSYAINWSLNIDRYGDLLRRLHEFDHALDESNRSIVDGGNTGKDPPPGIVIFTRNSSSKNGCCILSSTVEITDHSPKSTIRSIDKHSTDFRLILSCRSLTAGPADLLFSCEPFEYQIFPSIRSQMMEIRQHHSSATVSGPT